MLSAMPDVEYMMPYPPGYVTNQIRPRIADITVGKSVKFRPNDYAGIPIFHFCNTLKSVLTSEFGGSNIQMRVDKHDGVIEAWRVR